MSSAYQGRRPDLEGRGERQQGGEDSRRSHQGAEGCSAEGQGHNGRSGQKLPEADEHQAEPRHRDLHLQETPGGRGGEVSACLGFKWFTMFSGPLVLNVGSGDPRGTLMRGPPAK